MTPGTTFAASPLVVKSLTPSQVAQFQRDGFVRHPAALDIAGLKRLGPQLEEAGLTQARREAERSRNRESKYAHDAFIQVSSLSQKVPELADWVSATGIGELACQALGCEQVRLWGDHLLIKRSGGPGTPWHSDYYYIQTDTTAVCAIWIPFRALSLDEGPLGFIVGSHRLEEPSRYPIGPEGAARIQGLIDERGLEADFSPYALGDCSLHTASTLHGTRENRGDRARTIMTVFLVDARARVCEPRNAFQHEYPIGETGSPLNAARFPLVYPPQGH